MLSNNSMLDFAKNIILSLLARVFIYTVALTAAGLNGVVLGFKWFMKGSSFWTVKERSLPPFCLQDPKYGRHSYIQLKDVKLHYVENGDRSKPLMLFVHGFPEFWFTWRKQLPVFAKTHWVVALDMRGYNDSSKPSWQSSYRIEKLTKDIHDFVEALGRNSCTLIGHDWGGLVSWRTTIAYPDLVDKLIILNCPHPTAFHAKVTSSVRQFLKSWYMFVFQIPYLPEKTIMVDDLEFLRELFEGKASEEEMEAYKYVWSKKDAWTGPLNYYRCAMQPKEMISPPKFPTINTPTLIIWGERDLALEKDLATMSAKYVKNAKVKYLPAANHFVQWDAPEEVNQYISDFIS